jgi:superfamily II DNA/RNA helicase
VPLQHDTSRGDRIASGNLAHLVLNLRHRDTVARSGTPEARKATHEHRKYLRRPRRARHPLVQALTAAGRTLPFPIQAATLPDTLAGRDVLGRGKTGSGKTLALSIPLVTRLVGQQAPALATGRPGAGTHPELATQITATLEPLAAAYGLRVTTIFGGVPQGRQERALRNGVDIVVACPDGSRT